jgi:5-methylcytosine-specific restriction endonuclease McrA
MMITKEQLEEGGYSPGAQVRLILSEELPQEDYHTRSFANAVDRTLVADGRLAALVRESALDYAARRLIVGSQFVQATGGWEFDDPAFTVALRQYLREHTYLRESVRERLLPLLREATRLRDEKLGRNAKRSFREREREAGRTKCYICGREMDFEPAGSHWNTTQRDQGELEGDDRGQSELYATVEHVWPRRLGGINRDDNLWLACDRCNGVKDDALTGSDFHFERFVRAERPSLTIEDQMIAWYGSGLKCTHCHRPPIQVGELTLVRDEEEDCWHIHNVSAYCSQHVPADRD